MNENGMGISVSDFLQYIADPIFRDLAMLAAELGCNRGGAAIGFKGEDERIFKIEAEINPEADSLWGGRSDHYLTYAGLKVSTALETERDTESLPMGIHNFFECP